MDCRRHGFACRCSYRYGRGGRYTGEVFNDSCRPRRSCIVIVDIAIDPLKQTFGAEFLEPAIEPLAGFAEVFVGGIAESQDGKAQVFQPGRLAPFNEFEKAGCRLRRITFAIGADHDQQVFFLRQLPHLVIGHVRHRCGHPSVPGRRLQCAGEFGRVAGFAAIENGQAPRPCRRRCGRLASRKALSQPGKISAEPQGLRGHEALAQILHQLPL